MNLYDIVFYVFAALTVVSAIVTVTTKNIIYAAFALMFAFFGVAGIYALLNADFLAVTQILVYVGGILVLLVFGVMLTNKMTSVDIKTGTMQTLPASIIVAALIGTMWRIMYDTQWFNNGAQQQQIQATTKTLGQLLLTDFLLPFEIASVVLLVAIVGAALIARKEPSA
ncbi:MAG TPA: NADH-quinone oxidoreductase subunit J [Candidatus Kapabacteria bacterium]|nr:NADH-quinone oxidoreductase subunit J [Candidatus Kapabacteria bacterium]